MSGFPKSYPKQFVTIPLRTEVSAIAAKKSTVQKMCSSSTLRPFRGVQPLLLLAVATATWTMWGCSAAPSTSASSGDFSITSPASVSRAAELERQTSEFSDAVSTATFKKQVPQAPVLNEDMPTTRPASKLAAQAATQPAVAAGQPTTIPATQPAITIASTPSSPMGAMTTSPTSTPAPAPIAPTVAEPTFEAAMDTIRKQAMTHPTLNSALALALLNPAGVAPEGLVHQLSPADQRLCADLLTAIQSVSNSTASAESVSDRAAPLVDAARKWQADADLALPKCVFTSRVDSFGVYTPIEPKFVQGTSQAVIVYCEVANFGIRKSDDGLFETSLSQQETLVTTDGLLVWRPNPEEVTDKSHNERHDFYLVKKVTIPGTLALGKYMLRMSVTDHVTNKIALVTVPLEIVAK